MGGGGGGALGGGCQCDTNHKAKSQNPPHNVEPGLGLGRHGTEQLSTKSTSCQLPCGGGWLGSALPAQ